MFLYGLEMVPNILLVAAALGAVVFAISYAAFFNWKRTPAGRGLMQFVVALIVVFFMAAIGTFVGAHYVDGEYPLKWFVRTAGYGYLVYAMVHLIRVLWANWHEGHNEDSLVEPKKRINNGN
jgi:hypothetical protein